MTAVVTDSSEVTSSRPVLPFVNPATGERYGEVPVTSAEEVMRAVARARQAAQTWGRISLEERLRWCRKFSAYVAEHAEDIARAIVRSTGKARTEALAEVLYVCDVVGYLNKRAPSILAPERHSPHLFKHKEIYVTFSPMGVVGVIGPWNWPLLLTLNPALQALVAGNTVIIKPSEVTAAVGVQIAEIFERVGFPPDVLQVIYGPGETGAELIDGPVDKICFTGSVGVGKQVMAHCAQYLTPVTLELGGKDPMIVLADADLERAANAAVYGAFVNAGQVCMSVERLYVEESIAQRFTAMVLERTQQLRQGVPEQGDVDVGAITFPKQMAIIEAQVQDAVARGARVLAGGRRRTDLPGQFYEPTILTNVTDDMEVMREETFGPILPIITVRDAEEAIQRANNSRFGLAASIWSKDVPRAKALAERIEAGGVVINDYVTHFLTLELPYGGIKDSGMGRVNGEVGLRSFCHTKAVARDRLGLKKEFYWYPYSNKVNNWIMRGIRWMWGHA